jgi:hypothetical protein
VSYFTRIAARATSSVAVPPSSLASTSPLAIADQRLNLTDAVPTAAPSNPTEGTGGSTPALTGEVGPSAQGAATLVEASTPRGLDVSRSTAARTGDIHPPHYGGRAVLEPDVVVRPAAAGAVDPRGEETASPVPSPAAPAGVPDPVQSARTVAVDVMSPRRPAEPSSVAAMPYGSTTGATRNVAQGLAPELAHADQVARRVESTRARAVEASTALPKSLGDTLARLDAWMRSPPREEGSPAAPAPTSIAQPLPQSGSAISSMGVGDPAPVQPRLSIGHIDVRVIPPVAARPALRTPRRDRAPGPSFGESLPFGWPSQTSHSSRRRSSDCSS